MTKRLVIFDMDGTLVDSGPSLSIAVNAMLGELGRPPLDYPDVRLMIGDGTAKLAERALAARPGKPVAAEDALALLMRHYDDALAETPLYPGVREVLERLKAAGLPLAVSTNKPVGPLRKILSTLDLDRYFDRLVGGDSGPWRKPDPRMITTLLSAFAVTADKAIMVGDSEVDADTATAAGVDLALMTYGYHRGPIEAIPARFRLDHMRELPDHVLARSDL